jgi:mRNA interferase RelE/StbE
LAWIVSWRDTAKKQLARLDKPAQLRIIGYLKDRVIPAGNPRIFGKPLRSSLKGLWRYRVDDYRLICQLDEDRLMVLVVAVGHRREVYE